MQARGAGENWIFGEPAALAKIGCMVLVKIGCMAARGAGEDWKLGGPVAPVKIGGGDFNRVLPS